MYSLYLVIYVWLYQGFLTIFRCSYNNLAYGLDTKTGSKSQAYELKCDEIKYETYII